MIFLVDLIGRQLEWARIGNPRYRVANGQKEKVEQRNVDEIIGDVVKAYEIWSKDK